MEEKVILVDVNDNAIGVMEKMEAHRRGMLHRAISVIVRNDRNEILMQQRALHKYHTPGLWSNTCCSHPRPGEDSLSAANRRLKEEMGFTCRLEKAFDFIYKAEFPNGLTEYELDHVYVGRYNSDPEINHAEAHDFRWINLAVLQEDVALFPEKYTIWFRIILKEAEMKYPDLLKD